MGASISNLLALDVQRPITSRLPLLNPISKLMRSQSLAFRATSTALLSLRRYFHPVRSTGTSMAALVLYSFALSVYLRHSLRSNSNSTLVLTGVSLSETIPPVWISFSIQPIYLSRNASTMGTNSDADRLANTPWNFLSKPTSSFPTSRSSS